MGRGAGTGRSDPARRPAWALPSPFRFSGVLQLAWLYWFMRRAGFRIPFGRPKITARVKEMGALIVPAVFGAGVYQISRFIDLAFIRILPDGSLTYMAMADRWNQLPLGIIGIALGTAILPALVALYLQGRGRGSGAVAGPMRSNSPCC